MHRCVAYSEELQSSAQIGQSGVLPSARFVDCLSAKYLASCLVIYWLKRLSGDKRLCDGSN